MIWMMRRSKPGCLCGPHSPSKPEFPFWRPSFAACYTCTRHSGRNSRRFGSPHRAATGSNAMLLFARALFLKRHFSRFECQDECLLPSPTAAPSRTAAVAQLAGRTAVCPSPIGGIFPGFPPTNCDPAPHRHSTYGSRVLGSNVPKTLDCPTRNEPLKGSEIRREIRRPQRKIVPWHSVRFDHLGTVDPETLRMNLLIRSGSLRLWQHR
jgi:hypothetical protein